MTIKEFLNNDIDVGLLEDNELCELIDNSHGWNGQQYTKVKTKSGTYGIWKND